MALGEFTIGADTAVVSGTGALLLAAFTQVWTRTRQVDVQRDAVAKLAMKLAEDFREQTNAERRRWEAEAEEARAEADHWRHKWEQCIHAHRPDP